MTMRNTLPSASACIAKAHHFSGSLHIMVLDVHPWNRLDMGRAACKAHTTAFILSRASACITKQQSERQAMACNGCSEDCPPWQLTTLSAESFQPLLPACPCSRQTPHSQAFLKIREVPNCSHESRGEALDFAVNWLRDMFIQLFLFNLSDFICLQARPCAAFLSL